MELKGYCVFDKETTIGEYMKRKASPFADFNWVVAVGWINRNTGGTNGTQHRYYGHDREAHDGWFADLLLTAAPKFLVGFNIKFDLLWAIRGERDYAAYQQWVVAGGQIWDTQMAEYLLDGMVQESHMLSLDEVAPRYGGEIKIDEVKAMWAAGVNTPDIPRQLLLDYLNGRGEEDDPAFRPGDIHNTELIFLGQLKAAKARKQLKSIQLNNGALMCTVEMERNGLRVDSEHGREVAKELMASMEELKGKLNTFLPELPFEFKWTSRKQLSAFIFGGLVPFKVREHLQDENGKYLYAQKDVAGYELLSGEYVLHYDPETPEQYKHYASGKKKGLPKSKNIKVDDLEKPKMKWIDYHYKFDGLTTPQAHWEGKEKGYYSTSSDVIEELGQTTDIPFLIQYANLAAISKDLGTYYIIEEFDEETEEVVKAKGMLTLVQPDGIVHHNLNMTATVTARFSHSNPNSGNLPRGDDNSAKGLHTSRVKEMFISRWGEDGNSISSDFTSLEVYCQANLSHDKQLVADLRSGLDMHCARLSTVENKDYKEVLLLCKGNKSAGIDADPVWEVKRTLIKVFSFQRAYGAGAKKIAAYLKVPVEDVEQWIIADDARYPGITRFNEKVATTVLANRVATTKWMNHPTQKVQVNLGRSHLQTFDGKRYVFQEQCSPDYLAKKGTLASFSPTEMKNYPVQGLGGEWMKAAMWMALKAFYFYKNFGGKALLVNTVHDALYADAHKDVTRKAGIVIHAAMLAASDYMEYLFETVIDVPVPCETTAGPSMASEKNFENYDDFDAKAQVVRTWLRNTFMNGYTPTYLKEI